MFNTIINNYRGRKLHFKLRCSKNNAKYLDLLAQINVLEYSKLKNFNNTFEIKLMYHKGSPNIHSIVLLNSSISKGLSSSILEKEFSSKKAIYIANTNIGLRLINSITNVSNVKLVLFKINIS